jgi:hypothetical protein
MKKCNLFRMDGGGEGEFLLSSSPLQFIRSFVNGSGVYLWVALIIFLVFLFVFPSFEKWILEYLRRKRDVQGGFFIVHAFVCLTLFLFSWI